MFNDCAWQGFSHITGVELLRRTATARRLHLLQRSSQRHLGRSVACFLTHVYIVQITCTGVATSPGVDFNCTKIALSLEEKFRALIGYAQCAVR